MCNPNSSIASRRYRSSALTSGSASLLTQKLMGTFITNNTSTSSCDKTTTNEVPRTTSYNHGHQYALGNETGYSNPATVSTTSTNGMSYYQPYDSSSSRFQHPTFETTTYNSNTMIAATTTSPPAHDVSQPNKPKRRRKPQKPGLTAKNQERHFVHHSYHDHANDPDTEEEESNHRRRGGVTVSFPLKLHSVLDQVEIDGFSHVISWQPHGRCFVIHKPKEFTDVVMPRYFRQTKLTSFQRQLNLYGFQRLTRGNDSGGYYHELFLRGRSYLCKRMARTKVKGTKFKAASSPEEEPNFYNMPPVIVTLYSSDCDNSEDGHSGHHGERSYQDYNRGEFQPPHHHFSSGSTMYHHQVQPQEAPVSPMVNKFAMQTFGTLPMGLSPAGNRMGSQFTPSSPIAANARISAEYVASPVAASALMMPSAPSGSEYMDQAVDDLFLEDSQAVNEIMDFVNVWDADFEEIGEVTNDIQLGNLLDKLLED